MYIIVNPYIYGRRTGRRFIEVNWQVVGTVLLLNVQFVEIRLDLMRFNSTFKIIPAEKYSLGRDSMRSHFLLVSAERR